MPELRHLRVLLAVAEERNFTRAAERLHLAQPAVSRAIAQLERELGVELLERTTREVHLTTAGTALTERAAAIVADADAAFALVRAHGRGLAGEIEIGVTPAVGPATQADVARRLREDAPELSVRFHAMRPGEVGRDLRERRVEVVLSRSSPRSPEVDVAELAPTPAQLMVPDEHPLRDEAALADLDGARLLVWSPAGTPYTELLARLCAAAGAQVELVESPITGGGELVELAELDAVAITPVGWPAVAGTRAVRLRDDARLPLLAARRPGPAPPAVARLVELLSG